MKVYIAAPYELRDRAISLMQTLERVGHEVTSSWLKGVDRDDHATAQKDLDEVAAADMLMLINPGEFRNKGTGGRHVEVGYALALGKRVQVLGVRSNIFHHLDHVTVIDWDNEVTT